MELEQLLFSLVVIWGVAKIGGQVAERLRQPTVVGELLGGVLVGEHVLGLVPEHEFLTLLAHIAIIVLLFEVGLETDLFGLLRVGPRSVSVAVAGMVLPFAGGYGVCLLLGLDPKAALLIGAALSATSIAITTRTLRDLGESGSEEGKIVLGAAVIDDVLALVILGIVSQLMAEGSVTAGFAALAALKAVLFLGAAIVLGHFLAKPLLRLVDRMTVRDALVKFALIAALVLALGAQQFGSAPIIGAFAAGVVLAGTHRAKVIEQRLQPIASIFTPVFFVMIGASMDISVLNPFDSGNHSALILALLVIIVAVIGKLGSGLAAWGKGIRKGMIGAAMAPRGEVVLVFAGVGREAEILNDAGFAALVITVCVTAVVGPTLITWFARRGQGTATEDGGDSEPHTVDRDG